MTTSADLLATLSTWLTATHVFDNCERGLDKAPVVAAADALAEAVVSLAGPGLVVTANAVVGSVRAVTKRFVDDAYGDDDTDAPCDVEWDVHSLVAVLDPTYAIPEEVEPAHVVGTLFPHPRDED